VLAAFGGGAAGRHPPAGPTADEAGVERPGKEGVRLLTWGDPYLAAWLEAVRGEPLEEAEWVAAAAALALLLGLLLVLTGSSLRRRFGMGGGHTVSLDGVTLTSYRLGLTNRLDRLIREDGALIPEEWKSARVVRPSHRTQPGVYFLLVEEELRVRPPHGFVVLGDGTRNRIENTEELRAWVLGLVARIRAARAELTRPVPVSPWPGQCRRCGVRDHCSQRPL
jgi:hypothetical protein